MMYLFSWLGIRVKIVYAHKVNILGIQEESGLGRKKSWLCLCKDNRPQFTYFV